MEPALAPHYDWDVLIVGAQSTRISRVAFPRQVHCHPHCASHAYRRRLAQAGFTASMSRRGNCWDNAVVESFFATLTKELLVEGPFPTRDAARHAVFAFIEVWYNRRRRHSALGYRTPAEYAK